MREPSQEYEIHFVKFVFAFFMILNHILIWSFEHYLRLGLLGPSFALLGHEKDFPPFQFLTIFSLGIPITAGIIFRDRLDKYIIQGRIMYFPLRKILREVLFLCILEGVVRSMAFGPLSFLDWSELRMISLSFVVIVLLGRIKIWSVGLIGVIVLLSFPLVLKTIGARPSSYVLRVLVGNNGNHFYWPFFPWFFSVAFGFIFHDLYLKRDKKSFLRGVGVLAAILTLVSWALPPLDILDLKNLTGGRLYSPPLSFFVTYIDVFLLTFLIGSWAMYKLPDPFKKPILGFSRGILVIYVFLYAFGFRICQFFNDLIADSMTFSLAVLFPFFLWSSWKLTSLALKYFDGTTYQIIVKKMG